MRSSGAKGLPFCSPIEAKRPSVSGSKASFGFHLQYFVNFLIEVEVVGMNRTVRNAAHVGELRDAADERLVPAGRFSGSS